MIKNFTHSQFVEISNCIIKLTSITPRINRTGNITFDTGSRFHYTIYNYGTKENPHFMIRKFNHSRYNEYNSSWILNRSNGVINYFTSVKDLIIYFTNYVITDPNRLKNRYYDFSWSNRYNSDKHWN